MYPRTLTITRTNANPQAGAQPYGAMQVLGEQVLFTNIPAEVQMQRRAGQPDPGLPGDGYSLMGFDIFIPPYALDRSARLRRGDIVTDDLGTRYFLMGSYWNVLGWKLTTSIMES